MGFKYLPRIQKRFSFKSKPKNFMKYLRFVVLLFVAVSGIASLNLSACTSLSVKTMNNRVWYAANFDYPDCEIRFVIHTLLNRKVFQTQFLQNGIWLTANMANTAGTFAPLQMQYPVQGGSGTPGTNQVYIDGFAAYAIYESNSLSEMIAALDTIELIQSPITTIHTMLCYENTGSAIFEKCDQGNAVTLPDTSWQILSNFEMCNFAGLPYNQVSGIGANRYIAGYEYLLGNYSIFDFEKALGFLETTQQAAGSYKTLCSLVFDVENDDIFVCLERDFSKILRISVDSGFITSYRGWETPIYLPINESGLTVSEIMALVSANSQNNTTFNVQIQPNPFTEQVCICSSTDNQNETTITILNLDGMRVKTIYCRQEKYIWDGKDENGNAVNRGVYLAVISTKKTTVTKKLVKL